MIQKRFLVVATTLLALAAGQSAWAQQHARPDGTTTPSGWSPVNAATLHDAVNEPTFDHSDYIDSGAGNNSTVVLTLSDVSDPGTYANNHFIRYYCQATVGSKPKGGEGCDVALYQGGTQIATTLNNTASRGSFSLLTYTIPDASAITDYTNLELRITSSSLDVDESIQVSWAELEVPLAASSAPSVTTIPASGVTSSQATLGGNVSSDGNDPLTDVGVYYSTTDGFTPPGQGTQLPMTIQPVPGNFSGDLTSLPAGTTYYYRAYATNSIGERIATNQEQFTTKDLPVMTATPTVTIDSPTSATLGGTMTSNGFDASGMVDCGVEWSDTSGGPYTAESVGICSENVAFTTPLIGLTTGQDYYFRSYATNSVGTGYSNERQFKPVDKPSVTGTVDTPSITDTTAVLGGDITDTGGDAVTAVGIIWDTDGDPVNGGTNVPMTVADPFLQLVTGLPAGTPLWFVAYATNSAGPGYSAAVPFTTDPGAPTMDPTPSVNNVVADGADLGGTMTSDGGGTISDCGVEWSETAGGSIRFSQSAGVCAVGVGFATSVSGLTTGTTYYFRAYATNEIATDYSNEGSFVPRGVPVVVSSLQTDVTHNSAILGGNVTSDEGLAVTARGIVWDTIPISADPTSQPTANFVPMGSGIGLFSQQVSLPSGQTIYFEAYATNAAGTSYSSDSRSFPTPSEPTVQASGLVVTPFGRSVRVSWTRGNGDGSLVAVWQAPDIMDPPVDLTDYIADPDYSAVPPPPETSTNSGNFVVYKGSNNTILVTGLDLSMTYNVAVYEYAGLDANSDYIQTNPATGPMTTGNTPIHNYDYRIDCEQCHKHGSNRPRQDELETKCKTCHDLGGLAESKRMFKNHLLPTRNPDIDFVDCGMCHELHRSGLTQTRSISFVDSVERLNKSFLRKNVTKYVPNAVEPAVLHNDQPKREADNPNGDPVQPAVTPERAVEGGDATTARGYCQVCHTMTGYHRNNPSAGASTPADYGKAGLMQCHDGSTENVACAEEVQCGDCHEHDNSFIGVNNNLPCEQCHDQVQGSRPIITTQFDTANVVSSHIPNGTPTQADCVVCHAQHTHDGTVYGLDADDGATKWGTSNPNTLATGAGEVFEPHCMSCHDDGFASSLPTDSGAPTAGQTQRSPFVNANQPPVVDPTAWSAAGHNRPLATFPAAPVSCVGDGANGCHGSGHGSQQNSLLADAAGPTISMLDFCINCHDGDPASAVLPDFTGVLHTETSASKAPINNRHDVTASDQAYSGATLTCSDCHNPHADEAGKSISDLITGGALRDYSLNNSYTADTYNFSYNGGGNLDPINPEGSAGGFSEPDTIQFCLVCHDGPTHLPAGVVQSADMEDIAAAWAGNDVHGSGNAVGSGGSTNKGGLKPPYVTAAADGANADPSAPYAAMTCTTCHGAHGSGNIFNLRESITVAGVAMQIGGVNNMPVPARISDPTVYTLPLINDRTRGDIQQDHYWGAWCSFCHKMDTHPGKVETDSCTGGHMHNGGAF